MVVKGESPRCGANLPGWKLKWGARRGFSTGDGLNRLLKNYLRCLAVVKNSLKMLIYNA
jgi:uncharacterized protein (DUF3820 family)